jgi:hypothetical protein
MAYVPANLNILIGTVGGTFRLWHYAAGADAQATMRVANYFSDGYRRGMRSGDVILAILTTGAGAIFVCNSSVSGAPAATDTVDVNDGVAIAVTDTD